MSSRYDASPPTTDATPADASPPATDPSPTDASPPATAANSAEARPTAGQAAAANRDAAGDATGDATGEVRAGNADDGEMAIHQVVAGAMSSRAVAVVRDWIEAGESPDQIAILSRVNSALLPVQVALTDEGIPRTAPLDATVLGRTGIRTALAYLRIGLDPERIRREDILDTLNRPARKVKSAVQPFLRRSTTWSFDRLQQIVDTLDGNQADRFAGYLADLSHLSRAITTGADTARCLWIIRNRIGLGEAMDALDSSTTRPEGSSHGDDLDALEQLSDLHDDPATFRDWLIERLRIPDDEGGVTLSTVHRVKGMEWNRIVVFAANAGLMPHRLSEDIEEERRVFHVAVTRCREAVAVVGARDALSPFIAELTGSTPPSDHSPTKATPPGTPTRSVPTTTVDPRRREDGRIVAEAGLEVTVAGGFEGVVVDLIGSDAVVALEDGVTTRVPFGEPITVAGERTSLGPPPRTTPVARTLVPDVAISGDPDMVDPLVEALRDWRTRMASEQGMPPYIILHDNHLRAIAEAQPRDTRELARCPGIGPTKLEKYGDDILAIIDRT